LIQLNPNFFIVLTERLIETILRKHL